MDLCEWVRVSGAEWIPAARARHVELELIAPEDPVWVDVDTLLLEELLSNLIDNALRYGVGASIIKLRVGAKPPSLAVERLEEQTSELPSLMRIAYAVFCYKKKKRNI